jgi:hypothetical protein
MTLNELDFSKGDYWVQVHDLPLELMNQQNAQIIGDQMGQLLESEASENLSQQRKTCLRIKVRIPLNQPLALGFYQKRHNQPPSWVQFRYERLSDFCFSCGRLGHSETYYPFRKKKKKKKPRCYTALWTQDESQTPPSLKIENILLSPRHKHNLSTSSSIHHLPLPPSSSPPKRTQIIICQLPSPIRD